MLFSSSTANWYFLDVNYSSIRRCWNIKIIGVVSANTYLSDLHRYCLTGKGSKSSWWMQSLLLCNHDRHEFLFHCGWLVFLLYSSSYQGLLGLAGLRNKVKSSVINVQICLSVFLSVHCLSRRFKWLLSACMQASWNNTYNIHTTVRITL